MSKKVMWLSTSALSLSLTLGMAGGATLAQEAPEQVNEEVSLLDENTLEKLEQIDQKLTSITQEVQGLAITLESGSLTKGELNSAAGDLNSANNQLNGVENQLSGLTNNQLDPQSPEALEVEVAIDAVEEEVARLQSVHQTLLPVEESDDEEEADEETDSEENEEGTAEETGDENTAELVVGIEQSVTTINLEIQYQTCCRGNEKEIERIEN